MNNNRFSYQVTLVIWAALIFLLGVMMSCKSVSVRSGILIVHLTPLYVLYINLEMSSTMKFFLLICDIHGF